MAEIGGAIGGGRHRAAIGRLSRFRSRMERGERASVALIGDSWVVTPSVLYDHLANRIDEVWGIAASGYVSANAELSLLGSITRERAGIWTDVRIAGGIGPDAAHAFTTDAAATIIMSSSRSISHYRVHYGQRPLGATMRATTGEISTTIDTAGTLGYGTALLPCHGPLTLSIADPNVDGLTLAGVEMVDHTPGKVTLHKLGNGGSTAKRFLDIPREGYVRAMQELAPDLAIVVLGTNDNAADEDPTLFAMMIETLVDRIRIASPGCDILIIGPGPNKGPVRSIQEYNIPLRRLAEGSGFAFLDLVPFFASQPVSLRSGLYIDDWHPSPGGGFAIVALIWDWFFAEVELTV